MENVRINRGKELTQHSLDLEGAPWVLKPFSLLRMGGVSGATISEKSYEQHINEESEKLSLNCAAKRSRNTSLSTKNAKSWILL